MRRVAVLCMLLLSSLRVASNAGTASGGGDAPVAVGFTSAAPAGARVYHVENSGGFGVVDWWVNLTGTGEWRPWHMEFVEPNGSVALIPDWRGLTQDGDISIFAYAGAADASVQTPPYTSIHEAFNNHWRSAVPGTEGWLVLSWANQVDPITFALHFPAHTRVTFVAEGPVQAYQARDFRGGVRGGVSAPLLVTPAAPLVSLGNSVGADPEGGQLWGYVFHWKSTAFGRGALTFDRAGDGRHEALSLDATLDPTGGDACVCIEWGRWVFTSGSPIRVGFDYVGDGERTAVFVVVATLPAGTLPENVWQDFDLGPPRP